jgi:hypothetical protein
MWLRVLFLTLAGLLYLSFHAVPRLEGQSPTPTRPRYSLLPNIIRVPFTLTGGLITIRGRVDTVEGNFFFDTGASKLLLNERYFPVKKLRNTPNTARGVTGQVEVLETRKIDTLQFDNFLKTSAYGDVLNLSHLESSKKIALVGILGAELFEDFEILFDYDASLVILIRLNKTGVPIEGISDWEYEPYASVPLRNARHIGLLRLPCGPNGKSIWMGLDSGAEQNLLSKATSSKFLKENFDIRRRIKLNGMGGESVEVLAGMLKNAQIDSVALQPMATVLAGTSHLNEMYATPMDGVLGYEFFSQQPMSVNLKKRKLTIFKRVSP